MREETNCPSKKGRFRFRRPPFGGISHPFHIYGRCSANRSAFYTDGVAVVAKRRVAFATSRISKVREHRPGPKDALCGWTCGAISELGFWSKVKAGARCQPEEYACISRIETERPTPRLGQKTIQKQRLPQHHPRLVTQTRKTFKGCAGFRLALKTTDQDFMMGATVAFR